MISSLFRKEEYKLLFYSFVIFVVFTIFLIFSGYFDIGLMSDDYLNFISAENSSLAQKFTSSVPYYSNLHLRPVWFLSINLSLKLNTLLGFEKGNFILFRIENLLLFYLLVYLASRLLLKLLGRLSYSIVLILLCILYPTNLNDICWTAGKVDLLCGIFMLSSILFAVSYTEKRSKAKIYLSCIFFALSMLTKETAVVVPFIAILLVYLSLGREKVSEMKTLIGYQILVFIAYFSYRIFMLGVQPSEVVSKFQAPGVLSVIGVCFKAFVSLIIPFDYLSIQYNISNYNVQFAVYMSLCILMLVSVLFILIRTGNFLYIFLFGITFFISILPNLIAGYFRPQLILIPFIISMTALLIIMFKLKIRMRYFQVVLALLLLVCAKLSNNLIEEWKFSYEKSISSIASLVDMNLDSTKRNVVLGLPSRFRQSYMLDYATGAYNYWKYGEFKLHEKINDLMMMGSLDAASLNFELGINKIIGNEFEIFTTGESQYFMLLDVTGSKHKDREIEVRLSEKNLFNKSTYARVKIVSDNIDVYVLSKDNFIKLVK